MFSQLSEHSTARERFVPLYSSKTLKKHIRNFSRFINELMSRLKSLYWHHFNQSLFVNVRWITEFSSFQDWRDDDELSQVLRSVPVSVRHSDEPGTEVWPHVWRELGGGGRDISQWSVRRVVRVIRFLYFIYENISLEISVLSPFHSLLFVCLFSWNSKLSVTVSIIRPKKL